MSLNTNDYQKLAENIKAWGKALGFSQVGIADLDVSEQQASFKQWLAQHYHGEMHYMAENTNLRTNPAEILPGSLRCISVRLDYLPNSAKFAHTLKDNSKAYISRYALGRDYHKLMRNRLKKLGEKIQQSCLNLNFRPFVDSAPILERPLAKKAGLGWIGKHSLLINKQAGSWFFLGELLVDIPLPVDQAVQENCGSCVACLKICPTSAIVSPYVVDARRCISYLTIEHKGIIDESLRPLMGNRIYGCDDCQLICPWNKFAPVSNEADFQPRQNLDSQQLLALFAWQEADFLTRLQGSAIRRIGFDCWQRNIAIALGNCDYHTDIISALTARLAEGCSDMLKEHLLWAIAQQQKKAKHPTQVANKRRTLRLIRSIEKGLPRDA